MQSTSLINFEYYGKEKTLGWGCDLYRLDTTQLRNDKVYLIFYEYFQGTFLVIDSLKNLTFSNTPNKLTLESKEYKGYKFYAVSLPKEFTQTCKKFAADNHLTVQHISQAHFPKTGSKIDFGAVIPESDKILVIRGNYSLRTHLRILEDWEAIGKSLDKLGID